MSAIGVVECGTYFFSDRNIMSYFDMLTVHLKKYNLKIEKIPDSFVCPDWERAEAREEMTMRMEEVSVKREAGLAAARASYR